MGPPRGGFTPGTLRDCTVETVQSFEAAEVISGKFLLLSTWTPI
jgi:hypothetical protein